MTTFAGCYLLHSKHPQSRGRSYIGFTVNPRRRIKQHNGVICNGAWKTSKWRPWEMSLVVYGFTTQVQALQFEWAWQHPTRSKAVRGVAAELGARKMRGLKGKIALLQGMLAVPPWCFFPLTLQYLSSEYANLGAKTNVPHPAHLRVVVAPMEDLPGPASTSAAAGDDDEEEEEEEEEAAAAEKEDQDLEDGAACDSDVQGVECGSGEDDGRAQGGLFGAVGEVDFSGDGGISDGDTEAGVKIGVGVEGQEGSEGEQGPGVQKQQQQQQGQGQQAATQGGAKTRRPKIMGLECDLCEKEIERNVMRCNACRRAFHLECLAADWHMQATFNPLTGDTADLQGGVVAAATVPSRSSASQHQPKASAPTVPERGHCPACFHEHSWLELLASMLPFGKEQKPRQRQRTKRTVKSARASAPQRDLPQSRPLPPDPGPSQMESQMDSGAISAAVVAEQEESWACDLRAVHKGRSKSAARGRGRGSRRGQTATSAAAGGDLSSGVAAAAGHLSSGVAEGNRVGSSACGAREEARGRGRGRGRGRSKGCADYSDGEVVGQDVRSRGRGRGKGRVEVAAAAEGITLAGQGGERNGIGVCQVTAAGSADGGQTGLPGEENAQVPLLAGGLSRWHAHIDLTAARNTDGRQMGLSGEEDAKVPVLAGGLSRRHTHINLTAAKNTDGRQMGLSGEEDAHVPVLEGGFHRRHVHIHLTAARSADGHDSREHDAGEAHSACDVRPAVPCFVIEDEEGECMEEGANASPVVLPLAERLAARRGGRDRVLPDLGEGFVNCAQQQQRSHQLEDVDEGFVHCGQQQQQQLHQQLHQQQQQHGPQQQEALSFQQHTFAHHHYHHHQQQQQQLQLQQEVQVPKHVNTPPGLQNAYADYRRRRRSRVALQLARQEEAKEWLAETVLDGRKEEEWLAGTGMDGMRNDTTNTPSPNFCCSSPTLRAASLPTPAAAAAAATAAHAPAGWRIPDTRHIVTCQEAVLGQPAECDVGEMLQQGQVAEDDEGEMAQQQRAEGRGWEGAQGEEEEEVEVVKTEDQPDRVPKDEKMLLELCVDRWDEGQVHPQHLRGCGREQHWRQPPLMHSLRHPLADRTNYHSCLQQQQQQQQQQQLQRQQQHQSAGRQECKEAYDLCSPPTSPPLPLASRLAGKQQQDSFPLFTLEGKVASSSGGPTAADHKQQRQQQQHDSCLPTTPEKQVSTALDATTGVAFSSGMMELCAQGGNMHGNAYVAASGSQCGDVYGSGAFAGAPGTNCCTPLERPGWLNKRARMRSPLPLLPSQQYPHGDATAVGASAALAQEQGDGSRPLPPPAAARRGAQHSQVVYGASHSVCDSSDGEDGLPPGRMEWRQSLLRICDGSDDGDGQEEEWDGNGGDLGLDWDAACIYTQDGQHQGVGFGAGNVHKSTFENVLGALGGSCHEPEVIEID